MDLSKIKCLTISYNAITNCIICSVVASFPKSLLSENEEPKSNTCYAIWDTGATNSAITELTAKKLNLTATGMKKVSGLGGTIEKNRYLIDLQLPNGVSFPNLPVTELDNPIDDNGKVIDTFGIIIGMDIISAGDFTITNFEGKTLMSFRMPSIVRTDYTDEWNRRKRVEDKYKRK